MNHRAVAPRGDDYALACSRTFWSISHVGINEGSLGHRSALSHRQFPHMHLNGHTHTGLIEHSQMIFAYMLKCTEIESLTMPISAQSVGKDTNTNTWNRMAVSDTMRFKVSEHRVKASTRHIQNSTVLCSASQRFITWNTKRPQYKAQILSAILLKTFGIGQKRRELFTTPPELLLLLLSYFICAEHICMQELVQKHLWERRRHLWMEKLLKYIIDARSAWNIEPL